MTPWCFCQRTVAGSKNKLAGRPQPVNALCKGDSSLSGANQHFIPRSFLRGFGQVRKRGYFKVTIHSKERGIFPVGPDGAAAARFFYSRPAADAARTLDDEITDYETQFAEVVADLRNPGRTGALPTDKIAEIVVHLTVRNAQIREAATYGFGKLFEGTAAQFGDVNQDKTALGLDNTKPSQMWQEVLEAQYEEHKAFFQTQGMTKQHFINFFFQVIKQKFDSRHPEMMESLQFVFEKIASELPNIAKTGHNQALSKTLAPEERIAALKALSWQICPIASGIVVLPDCIAIDGLALETCMPLAFRPNKEVSAVLMPLDSHRVLLGTRADSALVLPEQLNQLLVSCAWDFFVAVQTNDALGQLLSLVGSKTKQHLDSQVELSIAKA